jgi:DNA topoisomerase-1
MEPLRHVSDDAPGIRRRRAGGGFSYVGPDGRVVSDRDTLARIRSLAIPPAWTDVWICPIENGHIQATGRDARGRKQYRYHDRWRELRDEAKYDRLLPFGEKLPRLRRRVQRDLARPGMPREKVVAAVVRLMDRTLVRIGNDEYARQNGSFGATTLREEHVDVRGDRLELRFRGKSGREHLIGLTDARLARVVKKLEQLPGQELFQYVGDDGELRRVTSDDVNDYLRSVMGEEFTAKDFRTWAGSVLGLHALMNLEEPASPRESRRRLNDAVKWVASLLGNTPAVCRRCYLHSSVIRAYSEGDLPRAASGSEGLRAEEQTLLRLLRREARRAGPARVTPATAAPRPAEARPRPSPRPAGTARGAGQRPRSSPAPAPRTRVRRAPGGRADQGSEAAAAASQRGREGLPD